MANHLFRDVLIIFFLSIPIVFIFRRLKLPPLLGFLVTGALIGPAGFGHIQDKEQNEILAEIGVTLLLFFVGLEFSFDHFARMKRQTLLGGSLQIAVTVFAGCVVGYLLGWNLTRGIFFGLLITLSSTAVVLSTLSNNRLMESVPGRVSTAILILQDLAFIPIMALLPLFKMKGEVSPLRELAIEAAEAASLMIAVYLFSRFLAKPLFWHITRTRSRELFVITIIAFSLGLAWVTNYLGFSFALGAFLAGLMVGVTEYHYQALAEIQPFHFCFNSLFFVSIGMLLDLDFIVQHWLLLLFLLIFIPGLKSIVTTVVLALTGLPLRIAIMVGIFLAQIGEFSFILASVGENLGIIPDFLYHLLIATAVIAMMVTPVMIPRAHAIAGWICRLPGIRRLAEKPKESLMEEKVEELENHVIICGFGPLGQTFANLLHQHNIPFLVLELNPETIEKIRAKQRPAFFGDGASEEILFRSGIEKARMLAITVPDFLNAAAIIQQARKLNPGIRIITRAKYRNEVEKLYAAGADIVISEELEGGVEMARYSLKEMGLAPEEADVFIRKVREFGSADFF